MRITLSNADEMAQEEYADYLAEQRRINGVREEQEREVESQLAQEPERRPVGSTFFTRYIPIT